MFVEAPDLVIKAVQAFSLKGLKYVYLHCQEDNSEKHQTYFTMMREESEVPKIGETVNVVVDCYQTVKKNPRGDCRVPDPTNGNHYYYNHENGK